MMRFFNKLNTPAAVLIVLALILAVNGFLVYRNHAVLTANAPPPAEAGPGTTAAPGEATVPEETSEETEESAFEDMEEPEPTEETDGPEEREEPAGSAAEEDGPPPDPVEAEAPAPERPAPVDLGGLGEFMRGCGGEGEECVQEFVARAAPEARYIGGRTDLDVASEGGRDREVLYFEVPTLGECENVRQEHEAENSLTYVVIVMGQGSFDSTRGPECIPAA